MARRNEQVSRRTVLRTTGQAVVAAGLGGMIVPAMGAPQTRPADAPPLPGNAPKLPFGLLGKTKHPVTLVSLGAILMSERQGSRVIRMAVDAGVNLIHTSASYGKGKSIDAVKGYFEMDKANRDKVFLCLKSFHPEKESEIDDMLKVLGTDHADAVLTTHEGASMARLEAIQKQQDALKKKGKVKHTGFVCHEDMNGVMELVLDKAPDYFDMTLMCMRPVPIPGKKAEGREAEEGQRFLKNLKAFKEKSIGILSMKSGARKAVTEGRDVFEPHVKMYLEVGADSMLTSIDTFEQVDMVKQLNLKTTHPSFREKQAAADFLRGNATDCLMCGTCTKVCPQRLPVADLMRMRMYDVEYGWHAHARSEFASVSRAFATPAATCGDCDACGAVCPVRLAGRRTVQTTAASLSRPVA